MSLKELEILSKGYLQVGNIPNNEKVVIGHGGDHHHTIHFGFKSGILDFHKTYHDERPQETLFEIRHFTLARLLAKFNNRMRRAYYAYWFSIQINIGKLKKNNCFLNPITTDESQAKDLVEITRSGKRFRFKKEMSFEKFADKWMVPEQLENAAPGAYLVYKWRRGCLILQGIIIKHESQKPTRSFAFCSMKNYNKYMRDCTIWMFKFLREAEIKSKYKKIALDLFWDIGVKKYIKNFPKTKSTHGSKEAPHTFVFKGSSRLKKKSRLRSR